jgi:hypothetical protein
VNCPAMLVADADASRSTISTRAVTKSIVWSPSAGQRGDPTGRAQPVERRGAVFVGAASRLHTDEVSCINWKQSSLERAKERRRAIAYVSSRAKV